MTMAVASEEQDRSGFLTGLLFSLTLLFLTVSLTPFPSLTISYAGETPGGDSGALKQLVAVTLIFALMVYVWRARRVGLLMQLVPAALMVFGWFALASLFGLAPVQSLRRLVMAGLLCAAAAAMLQLPRDERQFAVLLAIWAGIVIVVSYLGVLLIPERAIHQATDFLEPQLAGDWRGLFDHKNAAAAAMAIFALTGLYIAHRLSKPLGWALTLLALFFLFKSGGKTAVALFPLVLVLTAIIERATVMRHVVVIGTLASMALFTIGGVIFPAVANFTKSIGIDTTFTNRTDIWTLAIDSIRDHPIFGYGYQAFWQRDELKNAFQEVPTWAVAAVDSHNAYLEMLLAAGFPGLAILLFWILWLPLRDIGIARRQQPTALTRYYIRIWLYVLLLGFLESTFLISGATWFMLLMAIFGLRFQGQAQLIEADRTPENPQVMPRFHAE